MSNDHILPTGTRLKNGEYEIVAKLGQGGFGITYRAEQTVLGRTVAVKEFYLDGRCVRAADGSSIRLQSLSEGDFEAYKSRFYEEAKLLARFGDLPGIVNVIDFFRENNTVYYVMDFVQGPTLHQYLLGQPQERMAPAEAAELVRKVAVSLAPVHTHNVLHRDLKPANIILRPNGEPVVLDFGAARAFISDSTLANSVIVTAGYAPPEQYNPSGKFGPTIDIYALGAVLYRLLTGKTPPPSPGRIAEDMPSPHQLNPSVPPSLSVVVMKAMAQKAAERFGTAEELAKELEALAKDAGFFASSHQSGQLFKNEMNASSNEVTVDQYDIDRNSEPLATDNVPQDILWVNAILVTAFLIVVSSIIAIVLLFTVSAS
jgi:serine/threonine protein kinase